MKKKILLTLLIVPLPFCMTACHPVTREMGGVETITLEPGEKLELITWKEDSLWILTRPMREDEVAETHTYKQDSTWGIMEGAVTIIEQK